MNRNPSQKKLLLLSIALFLLHQIGHGQLIQFKGKVVDNATQIGIGQADIFVSDIYNGTIYRQSTSNAEGDFVIEVPASQRVEMGVFHENYKRKILSFEEIAALHSRVNSDINLQREGSVEMLNLVIRAVSIIGEKIPSAILTIRNEATGEVIDKALEDGSGEEWRLGLTHGQQYEITLQADGYFERKWSFICDANGVDKEGVDWDFFKSKDIFTKREDALVWDIQLWPNNLNAQFELRDIVFSPGESYILPKSVKVLDKLMSFLTRYPGVVFEMQHHSNDWGDYQRDLLFSQWRAQVLLDYLAERGELPSDQLAARGLGHALLNQNCKGAIQCQRKNNSPDSVHDHARTTLKVIAYDKRDKSNTQQGGYYDHNKKAPRLGVNKNTISGHTVIVTSNEYTAKVRLEDKNITKVKDGRTSEEDNGLEDKFTGYAVQILKTKQLLPASHPVWNVQGIWVDHQVGSGYAYLVGNFSEKEKGFDTADVLRKEYQGAFVVSYFNGERLY